MSATIELAGIFKATIRNDRVWRVRAEDPIIRENVEKFLNAVYGRTWTPPFGVYVPDMTVVAAEAAAVSYGAVVTKIGPPPKVPKDAIRRGRCF